MISPLSISTRGRISVVKTSITLATVGLIKISTIFVDKDYEIVILKSNVTTDLILKSNVTADLILKSNIEMVATLKSKLETSAYLKSKVNTEEVISSEITSNAYMLSKTTPIITIKTKLA